MKYPDGQIIELGDTVSLDMPNGWQEARVVMLGSTREHLEINQDSLDWYGSEGMDSTDILVQWTLEGEPQEGGYMATNTNCCIELVARRVT